MNSFKIEDILEYLKKHNLTYDYSGAEGITVSNVSNLEGATKNSLCFLKVFSASVVSNFNSKENLLILSDSCKNSCKAGENFLFVEEPQVVFYLISTLMKGIKENSISSNCEISDKAEIGNEVRIDALSFIGPNVIIGDGVTIGPGCILNNCEIGSNSILQAGVSLGHNSLGPIKDKRGEWVDKPHFKKVIIGSNVVLEDKVVINRGFLEDTVISSNVRIGAGTCIGNAVHIGEGSLTGQSVTIAGSVKIKKNVSLWGNCSIRDGSIIHSNSVIGMGSVILNDIPSNELWAGCPAKFIRSL